MSNMFHPTQGVRCLYVRDRYHRPHGLIMTVRTEKKGVVSTKVGWSLCHPNDIFNKYHAKVMAAQMLVDLPATVALPEGVSNTPMNRALAFLSENQNCPNTIRRQARRMLRLRAGMADLTTTSQGSNVVLVDFQRRITGPILPDDAS